MGYSKGVVRGRVVERVTAAPGLARVFGAVGREGFWRALVDTLRLLVPLDNALVAVMQAGRVPSLLIDFDSRDAADEHEELADYRAGMYLLDPFYLAVCAASPMACTASTRWHPTSSSRASTT
jgi:hypothetical protein